MIWTGRRKLLALVLLAACFCIAALGVWWDIALAVAWLALAIWLAYFLQPEPPAPVPGAPAKAYIVEVPRPT
jgi:hypothetical protein